ncbi:class I SAM-dependent methyltransferase [Mycobacteroides abscessus]
MGLQPSHRRRSGSRDRHWPQPALLPETVRPTGIDWSEQILDLARDRAADLGHPAVLQRADAHRLPFDDASFDAVVCPLGLCAIPNHTQALTEMTRVLRPGGRLVLVDHIRSSAAHWTTSLPLTASTLTASSGSPSGSSNGSSPVRPPRPDSPRAVVCPRRHHHERSRT